MRKILKLGLAIVVALAIIGTMLALRVGRPLSQAEAVELARGWAWEFLVPLSAERIERVELLSAQLLRIELVEDFGTLGHDVRVQNGVELLPIERETLVGYRKLPDKVWLVEFEVEKTCLRFDATGMYKIRIIIDAYTGRKLALTRIRL